MDDAAPVHIPADGFAGLFGFRKEMPLGGTCWQGERGEDNTEQKGFHQGGSPTRSLEKSYRIRAMRVAATHARAQASIRRQKFNGLVVRHWSAPLRNAGAGLHHQALCTMGSHHSWPPY